MSLKTWWIKPKNMKGSYLSMHNDQADSMLPKLLTSSGKEIEVGSCEFFDSKPFIQAAEILVAADEPLRALQLLDNLPGYYRDHVPADVHKVRDDIYAKLATPTFYKNNIHDDHVDVELAKRVCRNTLRGSLIEIDVKKYNESGLTPHIVDLGPGEYWLPIALHEFGYQFTYNGVGLNDTAKRKAEAIVEPHLKTKAGYSQPTIFVACEIIEHLHHEEDLLTDFYRNAGEAAVIHISTPLYTFNGDNNQMDWRSKGDLGHLRTYTPNELLQTVMKMFPNYRWAMAKTQILHMRGEKA